MISFGDRPVTFVCTDDNSISNPFLTKWDNSDKQHDNPPPPRSFIALMQLLFTASIVASINNFSKKGSGI